MASLEHRGRVGPPVPAMGQIAQLPTDEGSSLTPQWHKMWKDLTTHHITLVKFVNSNNQKDPSAPLWCSIYTRGLHTGCPKPIRAALLQYAEEGCLPEELWKEMDSNMSTSAAEHMPRKKRLKQHWLPVDIYKITERRKLARSSGDQGRSVRNNWKVKPSNRSDKQQKRRKSNRNRSYPGKRGWVIATPQPQ